MKQYDFGPDSVGVRRQLRYKRLEADNMHPPGNWLMQEFYFSDIRFALKGLYKITFRPKTRNIQNEAPEQPEMQMGGDDADIQDLGGGHEVENPAMDQNDMLGVGNQVQNSALDQNDMLGLGNQDVQNSVVRLDNNVIGYPRMMSLDQNDMFGVGDQEISQDFEQDQLINLLLEDVLSCEQGTASPSTLAEFDSLFTPDENPQDK